jgi:hypothetical protein
MTDIKVKKALDDVIHTTETYPPKDLSKRLTTKAIASRNLKCKESNNEMKYKTSKPKWTKDTEGQSQSMNAVGNVTRTASRIYLEIIGIQMVIRREDSLTEIINEKWKLERTKNGPLWDADINQQQIRKPISTRYTLKVKDTNLRKTQWKTKNHNGSHSNKWSILSNALEKSSYTSATKYP